MPQPAKRALSTITLLVALALFASPAFGLTAVWSPSSDAITFAARDTTFSTPRHERPRCRPQPVKAPHRPCPQDAPALRMTVK
jgi:hypothetical protein